MDTLGYEFDPHYDPWEERLCLLPNDDFFEAIHSGCDSVVTDLIETFTETGIRPQSGEHLDADIIVTATGLDIIPLGGVDFTVDGATVDFSNRYAYKGAMMQVCTPSLRPEDRGMQPQPWVEGFSSGYL